MSLADRMKYAEMKARHQTILRPWYRKWWGILIIAVLALAFAALVWAASYVWQEVARIRSGDAQDYLAQQKQDYDKLVLGTGGYAYGALEPKITVVEFGDFACPFCAQAAPEIRNLTEKYKTDVRFIFRDYPIHDNSIDLAIAARCAGEQGKFWEAYDNLYKFQDDLKETGDTLKASLSSWAKAIGLDQARFDTCVGERRYVDLVKQDYDDGNKLQIQGTPTWFVNGHALTGYYPAEKLKELFDGYLQQYGKN